MSAEKNQNAKISKSIVLKAKNDGCSKKNTAVAQKKRRLLSNRFLLRESIDNGKEVNLAKKQTAHKIQF